LPDTPLRPIDTNYGLRVSLVDIINCAKLYRNQLRALDSLIGQILAIPIALQCQCGVNYCSHCDNVDEVTGLINPLMSAYHPNSHPITVKLTGLFADRPVRGQSSRGLDNLRTSQFANSEFLKIMELRHSVFTLN